MLASAISICVSILTPVELRVDGYYLITMYRADASRTEAAYFFNNKHIKCKHNGFSCVLYIEFMSCKPAVTTILNSRLSQGMHIAHYLLIKFHESDLSHLFM